MANAQSIIKELRKAEKDDLDKCKDDQQKKIVSYCYKRARSVVLNAESWSENQQGQF